MDSAKPLVQVVDLSVDYWQRGSWVNVVDGLDLSVDPAETFGLVGESGSGKSTTANAVLGYRPAGCRYRRGSVWFGGEDLHRLPIANLRKVWGRAISYVPQDPTTALSPGMTAGKQIAEVLLVHDYCSSFRQARDRTLELLSLVSLPDPADLQEVPLPAQRGSTATCRNCHGAGLRPSTHSLGRTNNWAGCNHTSTGT